MKNKVLSIIVAIALTISVLAITTGSVSAASKPNLSIANVSGGQRISWSSTGAQKYYLYFGVYDYNSQKAEWRVYREVKGTTYTINYNSLHASGWKRYVNYKSTPNLTSGQAYCYQIHAGKINASGRPTDSNYSKVKSMTYVAVPFLNWTIDNDNHVIFGAYSQGANDYQYRYRYNSESTYYYVSKVPYADYTIIDYDIHVRYEARALYRTANNGTAYSEWAHVVL